MVRYSSRRRPSSWNMFYSSFAGKWRQGNRGNSGAGDNSGPLKMQQAASQMWRQLDAAQKLKYARRGLSLAGPKSAHGPDGRAMTRSKLPFRSRTAPLNRLLDMLRAATLAGVAGAGRPLVTQMRQQLRNWQDNVIGDLVRGGGMARNRPVVRLF